MECIFLNNTISQRSTLLCEVLIRCDEIETESD